MQRDCLSENVGALMMADDEKGHGCLEGHLHGDDMGWTFENPHVLF